MRSQRCTWSVMAMIPMMAGMKAASRACEPGARPVARPPEVARAPKADLVETAKAAGVFSRLVEALQAAGLADTLKTQGPFTVFAPSDDAFAKLPAETLQSIIEDSGRLQSVLRYHVVPGRYFASDLAGIETLKTLQGEPLRIDTRVGVKVGTAYVIQADVAAANGVIHVIESVLLP